MDPWNLQKNDCHYIDACNQGFNLECALQWDKMYNYSSIRGECELYEERRE